MTGGQSIDLLMLAIIQQAQRKLSEQARREPLPTLSHLDCAAAVQQNAIAPMPPHPVEFN
jgi:hypothetical protein